MWYIGWNFKLKIMNEKYIEILKDHIENGSDTPFMIEATKVAIKKLKAGSMSIRKVERWLVANEKFERKF